MTFFKKTFPQKPDIFLCGKQGLAPGKSDIHHPTITSLLKHHLFLLLPHFLFGAHIFEAMRKTVD
jgi:hypothetical protein